VKQVYYGIDFFTTPLQALTLHKVGGGDHLGGLFNLKIVQENGW
jgi:hypothetical protein